ncbi:MAG: hypothetical protein AAGF96_06050 [Bacteroidota bacterium]
MEEMKTFNNDPKLKSELINQLDHHQKLDAFIQGQWLTSKKIEGNGFKGCFYGCTMQTEDEPIQKFSDKYNIDLWYCHLTEKIFENLPKGEFEKFPKESIDILPIGVDLNKMKSVYFQLLLKDQLRFCEGNEKCEKAIKKCIELFDVPFNEITKSAAESAESAARSAARSAAWSAARSAARSAESAARSAAWSAARSAAWSAARSAARSAESAAESAAKSDYYIRIKGFLFTAIRESYSPTHPKQ